MRPSAVLIASLVLVTPAGAKQANIGAMAFNLPMPDGYCELDGANQSDARLIKFMNDAFAASGNRLIAEFVDCKQLADWRIGKRKLLDDYVQYQTEVRFIDSSLPAKDAADLAKASCDNLRSQGEKATGQATSDINTRLDQISKTIRYSESRFLGVVADEPPVCYAAMLQKLATDVGTEKIQIALWGTTPVKGKLIHYYLFSPYTNSDTLMHMLAKHKANVDALIKANQ
jgi:hypothetical protein